jgi:hypothetical protein
LKELDGGGGDTYFVAMPLPSLDLLPPKLAAIVAHWQGLRRDGHDVPIYADFDPMAVARLLPNIYLLAVEHAPLRFRFRLLGEAVLEAGAPGRPGLYVDELLRAGTQSNLNASLVAAVASRAPNWYSGPPTLQHHAHVSELEGVMLPCAAADGQIEAILCLTLYRWQSGQET